MLLRLRGDPADEDTEAGAASSTPFSPVAELSAATIPSMQRSTPRIVQVQMSMPRPKPAGLFDSMPVVHVTFDDGTQKDLFSFYPDEIRFDEGELVGLTETEAHELRRQKDMAFLRSS